MESLDLNLIVVEKIGFKFWRLRTRYLGVPLVTKNLRLRSDGSTKGARLNWFGVCHPKAEGGLGLRDLLAWNKACIMKNLACINKGRFIVGYLGGAIYMFLRVQMYGRFNQLKATVGLGGSFLTAMDAKSWLLMIMLINGLLLWPNEAVSASHRKTIPSGRDFPYKFKSVSKRVATLSPPPSPKLRPHPSFQATPPPPISI
ncbi:hypothetical protein Gotri_001443 [Gossypium trilobum]|uniref:Uncharacterized protein n=1 Tax=Gossypium trilobum TaxID=34281 RepID=A0A7J9FF29_9ROSI|nr:hypothetical protein [Gossypium trilobum]